MNSLAEMLEDRAVQEYGFEHDGKKYIKGKLEFGHSGDILQFTLENGEVLYSFNQSLKGSETVTLDVVIVTLPFEVN